MDAPSPGAWPTHPPVDGINSLAQPATKRGLSRVTGNQAHLIGGSISIELMHGGSALLAGCLATGAMLVADTHVGKLDFASAQESINRARPQQAIAEADNERS